MENLERDIKRAEKQLIEFSTLLDTKTVLNSDRSKNVSVLFEEIGKLRSEMMSQYPRHELQKFNKNFAILVKQIQIKLDNVINNTESEKKAISERLKKLSVKKKLSIYNR
ncbi:MAG: hypothetical protein SCALA702_26560 [Melioribacteraceae bacterium]|nr:MAG: hypothetical protein SCALA702_26560 [Melioribacteraceae bacterium]